MKIGNKVKLVPGGTIEEFIEIYKSKKGGYERTKIGPFFRQTKQEIMEDLMNSYGKKEMAAREQKEKWKQDLENA